MGDSFRPARNRALGATEVVFQLQEEYPQLKLAIITPFRPGKEVEGRKTRRISNDSGTGSLRQYRYGTGHYGPWQFRARDQFLDDTDGIVLFYDEDGKEGSPKYKGKSNEAL